MQFSDFAECIEDIDAAPIRDHQNTCMAVQRRRQSLKIQTVLNRSGPGGEAEDCNE